MTEQANRARLIGAALAAAAVAIGLLVKIVLR